MKINKHRQKKYVSVIAFCKSINTFSLGFDVTAKYCKRLIKTRFLQKIMKKMILTDTNKCVQINSR